MSIHQYLQGQLTWAERRMVERLKEIMTEKLPYDTMKVTDHDIVIVAVRLLAQQHGLAANDFCNDSPHCCKCCMKL